MSVFEPLQTDEPTSGTSEMTSLLAQLGGVLLSVETVQTTVELVTRLAATTIPGSVGAGVTVVDERGHRTTAASSPLVAEADALQYANDSGPCLTAWREQIPVRVDDLTTEKRWPQWTEAAAELGVRSVLSVPLVTDGAESSIGAIKVYSQQPEVYDTRAEEVLSLFAEQAAILLTNMLTLSDARQLSGQLVDALQTRDLIGQAKGVLISRGVADEETAFAMLVEASQRSNVKLNLLARQFVASVVSGRDSPPVG